MNEIRVEDGCDQAEEQYDKGGIWKSFGFRWYWCRLVSVKAQSKLSGGSKKRRR